MSSLLTQKAVVHPPEQGTFVQTLGADPARQPALEPIELNTTPIPEQPRERLMRLGASTLSDADLLAILLGTGRSGEPVNAMASRVLAEWGGLAGLRTAEPASVACKGVGPAKASRILAVVEMATRIAFRAQPKRLTVDRPDAAARYLLLRYSRRDQEVMGALFLNVRNQTVHESEIFRGTLKRASVEPRAILREALSVGAAGFVVFHTHPSGDPTPSAEDLAFTERLDAASSTVGIDMVDHLILGDVDRWTSLRRNGCLSRLRERRSRR